MDTSHKNVVPTLTADGSCKKFYAALCLSYSNSAIVKYYNLKQFFNFALDNINNFLYYAILNFA